ncbi:MAG: DUF5069 domain-containing protein [Verrucomicrobia bacterium]|nr:DUF5069 domain-containing protein [Verrucomicrobiota bacterium]
MLTANHYRWHAALREIFDTAVARYRAGERNAATFFNTGQLAFLASIGHTAQELFDFAEDHVKNDGDPDWETTLLVASVRRDYFLNVQRGVLSGRVISMDDLPAKADELDGIPWLRRLIAKAHAKLRGEMPADLMYGCGGDRRFLQEYDLHPAEFLREVWATEGNEKKLLAYVKAAGGKSR